METKKDFIPTIEVNDLFSEIIWLITDIERTLSLDVQNNMKGQQRKFAMRDRVMNSVWNMPTPYDQEMQKAQKLNAETMELMIELEEKHGVIFADAVHAISTDLRKHLLQAKDAHVNKTIWVDTDKRYVLPDDTRLRSTILDVLNFIFTHLDCIRNIEYGNIAFPERKGIKLKISVEEAQE